MTDTAVYRALDMLLHEHEPRLRRRSPYWRPKPAPCWRDVHLPAWNWTHPDYHEGLRLDLTLLDSNGAFLSAASSATFAHGELQHTGALSAFPKWPGYYRVDAHAWSDPRIVSPLGSAAVDGKIWLAHPTVEYLWQLSGDGFWPEVRIHDSWTCADGVRLRSWATAVNTDRAAALRDVQEAERDGTEAAQAQAHEWYEAVKLGYSQAVQLMRGPAEGGTVKSPVRRPDWHATIHAQHAATTHRKIWRALLAGYVPVAMGSVDEVAYDSVDFANMWADGLLKVDNSGIGLGAFKVKERILPEDAEAAA